MKPSSCSKPQVKKKVNQFKKKKSERRKILWTEAIPEREVVETQVNMGKL